MLQKPITTCPELNLGNTNNSPQKSSVSIEQELFDSPKSNKYNSSKFIEAYIVQQEYCSKSEDKTQNCANEYRNDEEGLTERKYGLDQVFDITSNHHDHHNDHGDDSMVCTLIRN